VTREDIIREADAWLKMNGLASDGQTCFLMALFAQHISALAAAQEREACAKVCEDMGEFYYAATSAIRSRGEVKP
jgi:hypothetical protein